nr:hypothetical protein [Rubrobacter tropicus]
MEEAQMFFQTAADSNHLDGSCLSLASNFDLQIKTETLQAMHGTINDFRIGVVDTQRVVSVTTFRVEDACQESFAPGIGG